MSQRTYVPVDAALFLDTQKLNTETVVGYEYIVYRSILPCSKLIIVSNNNIVSSIEHINVVLKMSIQELGT